MASHDISTGAGGIPMAAAAGSHHQKSIYINIYIMSGSDGIFIESNY